jgi:hypothetical protein
MYEGNGVWPRCGYDLVKHFERYRGANRCTFGWAHPFSDPIPDEDSVVITVIEAYSATVARAQFEPLV